MHQRIRILTGLAVVLATLPGCVNTAPLTPAATPSATSSALSSINGPQPTPMDATLMYELLLGELSFNSGQAREASAYLLDAAHRTGDAALYRRAVEMAIQSRSGPIALENARAWRQAMPESTEAQRYELQVLLALGRVNETAEPVHAMIESLVGSEKQAFIVALPALYQRAPDKLQAVQTIERALSTALKDPALAPAAWTTIGRMRLQANDRAGALAAATLGADADPASQWPALLALQLFGGADEPRAEAVVKKYLAGPDAQADVQLNYARALVALGRMDDAQVQLSSLTARFPSELDGWLAQGLLYADERNDIKAEAALTRYLELAQQSKDPRADRTAGTSQARLALARIAERRGDDAQAERWLSQIDAPSQQLAVQIQRASLLARKGKLAQARKAIQSAPEQDADDVRLKLLAEAQLLREHGQAMASYQLLSQALEDSPDDDGLLYDAAMTAEKLGRLADMERMLRRVIELKPDAAHAYNALGYGLADRGVRLTEARQLIEKAAQLSPNDAYIQDSLGWVLFRIGHTNDARQVLEAAFKKRPDAEIAAHLGEVLWALSERQAARAMWRESQRLDPTNDTLQKTLKRLRVRP